MRTGTLETVLSFQFPKLKLFCLFNFQKSEKVVCEMLCLAHACVFSGEVLQNRLQMAHNLKQLTDVAHTMTSTELDDLRLHVKVV